MARGDVYREPDGELLLLDIQHGALDHLATRVVIPLMPSMGAPPAIKRLYPIFEIEGRSYLMATPLMSAVAVSELRGPVANVADHRDEITAAIDFLHQGF